MSTIHPQEAIHCLLIDDLQFRLICCPACGWTLFGRDDDRPGLDVGMVTFNWFTEVNEHLKVQHPGAMAFELCVYTNQGDRG